MVVLLLSNHHKEKMMKAFQVLWTPPLLQRTWGGFKIEKPLQSIDEMFSDYYLLAMILSVLQWKKLNCGPVKIYGDVNVITYLAKFDLLDLWDEYDMDTLKNLDKRIDSSCFYSAGKFYAYLREPAPCFMVDLDLILWKNLESVTSEVAVGFTHWEDTSPASYWYGPKEGLKAPKGYAFRDVWNWNLMAANTSLVYFKDDALKDYYASEALRYMIDNQVGGEFHLIKPELLFVEQRLLPLCIYEMGLIDRMKVFIDTIWNPSEGRFTKHDGEIGEWSYYDLVDQPVLTHLWIAKQHIEKNQKYRNFYCSRLLDSILTYFPELVTRLEKIGCLKEHLVRFSRKGTLEEFNRCDFTCDLFDHNNLLLNKG
jgi:hypothetical protein